MSYQASIKLMGKTYSAEGETKEAALRNLKVAPNMARSAGVLVLKHGEKTVEKILPTVSAMRLFSVSPSVREVNIKQVGSRFDL